MPFRPIAAPSPVSSNTDGSSVEPAGAQHGVNLVNDSTYGGKDAGASDDNVVAAVSGGDANAFITATAYLFSVGKDNGDGTFTYTTQSYQSFYNEAPFVWNDMASHGYSGPFLSNSANFDPFDVESWNPSANSLYADILFVTPIASTTVLSTTAGAIWGATVAELGAQQKGHPPPTHDVTLRFDGSLTIQIPQAGIGPRQGSGSFVYP